MRYLFNLRATVKGHHLRYSHKITGELMDVKKLLIKATAQVADRLRCPVENVEIEIESMSQRATHLMGGK